MSTSTGRPKRPPMTPLAVIEQVAQLLPRLAPYLVLDRAWVWLAYADKPSKQERETLKQIGFAFAGRGHRIGDQLAYWGHSCLKPTPRRRRGKSSSQQQPVGSGQSGSYAYSALSEDRELAEFLS